MHRTKAGLLAILITAACGSAESSEPTEVAFRAEHDLLGDFEKDTGFLPAASPASIRVVARGRAGFDASARAIVQGEMLVPVEGSGSISMDAGLSLEVSARIDTTGFEYEGVIETFDYGIEPATTSFDPFALEDPVVLSSELPSAELARVPIPSLPGATLIVDVAGGEIRTTYLGTCAAVGDGVAQYTASATVEGTVALEGTVELEIPLVGTESFGPFALDVDVPATSTTLDLGSVSTTTGEAAEGTPCSDVSSEDPGVAGSTTGDEPPGADAAGDVSSGGGETTGKDETTGGVETTGGDETTGGGETGSPDPECTSYPECPEGEDCVDGQCVPIAPACSSGLDCDACTGLYGCSQCVQFTGNACAGVLQACLDVPECLDLLDCVNDCTEQACADACADGVSQEYIEQYNAVATCLLDECR